MKQKDTTPLFMVAQLPFNQKETVALNKPMIPIMNDKQNVNVATINLKEMGIWKKLLKKETSFLEIGCGSGYLVEHLYKNGKGAYFGFEPIPSEYEKAKKRLIPFFDKSVKKLEKKLFKGILEEAKTISKIKPSSLDFIYSYHVFEHLENPLSMLEIGSKWLKKEGKMLITCPNVEGYFPKKNIKTWRCSLTSHRWLPGKKTIVRALERKNYKVLKYFTYGGYAAPRGIFKGIGNQALKCFGLGDVICVLAEKK